MSDLFGGGDNPAPPFDPSRVPAPTGDDEVHVYGVSELTGLIKSHLEHAFGQVYVAGEISNLRIAASGHAYFTLKDAGAQITVVMFRSSLTRMRFQPTDGLEVVVSGQLTVYPQRGNYQVVATRMTPKGAGALELALRQLRDKLAREGLFDPERKRPLPYLPGRIAVVTSPTGAAIRDILRVIGRRFPPARVVVFPVKVQGEGAAQEIAEAIQLVSDVGGFDVLIAGRGGGSIEDLWAFNEEVVARAIYASEVPVVSAVGHETDVTIADLVADRRALTPSEAAELVVPKLSDLVAHLASYRDQMIESMRSRFAELSLTLQRHHAHLRPDVLVHLVENKMQRLDDLQRQVQQQVDQLLFARQATLDRLGGTLHALSPLAVLGRGYSVTCRVEDGRVISDAAVVEPNARIRTVLGRGHLVSRVESVSGEAAPEVAEVPDDGETK